MNILFATDGSIHAKLAEVVLAKLPGIRGSITVASVLTPLPMLEEPLSALPADSSMLYGSWHDRVKSNVEESASRLASTGLTIEKEVLVGDAASELLDLAERIRADLIVVGGKGEGAVEGFLLGSVARRLLAYSKCTVLVARHPAHEKPDQTITRLQAKEKLSLALAYDGTPGAEAAAAWVEARGENAWESIVVSCAEPLQTLPFGVNPIGLPTAVMVPDIGQAEATVAHVVERLKGRAGEITTLVKLGRPSKVLIDSAAGASADLIALGATRHGVIERFLLGSVSYETATTAPCSVLVVRPSGVE